MTDGIEQWILDLPVWFQTPLVLAVLVLVALGIAFILFTVVTRAVPPSDEEEHAFSAEDAEGEPR
ncbi:MAG: hypothetical protein ACTH1D_09915 [Mycobacteriaceae bacterium]|uniref:hypothetical protein n=1 Tax=Corynebacterium sp. TaxID=1720 RepID=UPI003F9A3AC9